MAYQVAGRGLPREDVAAALRLATGGLVPDLTLVLDVPVEVGRERQRRLRKEQDRFERQDDAFHERVRAVYRDASGPRDRKSTRLNSSHGYISYAVFCLKKKKQ